MDEKDARGEEYIERMKTITSATFINLPENNRFNHLLTRNRV